MKFILFILLNILMVVKLNAQIENSPLVIHIIGDSHSTGFSRIPYCTIHWIGPFTMHRIGRDELSVLHLPSLGVKENQVAVFCFGEIDVRCHIGIQRDQYHRKLSEIIETLAKKYLSTILLNCKLYQNLTCIVYAVPPPSKIWNGDVRYPVYGTIEDRVNITKKLNRKLSTLCHKQNILFLDVYEDFANADGSLNQALSDGTIHINPHYNQPIQEKLFELLSIH